MPYSAASPPKMFTLMVLTTVSVLSLNMFRPSSSNIAAGFQADYGLVTLSVAGHLVSACVLMLVMARCRTASGGGRRCLRG